MRYFLRICSILMVLVLGMMCCNVFAATNEDTTMGDTQKDFYAYLAENRPEIRFGTRRNIHDVCDVAMIDAQQRNGRAGFACQPSAAFEAQPMREIRQQARRENRQYKRIMQRRNAREQCVRFCTENQRPCGNFASQCPYTSESPCFSMQNAL